LKVKVAILGVLFLSGCATIVGDKTPIEKVYYKSQSVQVAEQKMKDIKKTPIPQGQESFYPVINPPVIKRVWVLPHTTEEGNLVGGYWLYIIIKEPSWYIEENGGKQNIQVIIPFKEKPQQPQAQQTQEKQEAGE